MRTGIEARQKGALARISMGTTESKSTVSFCAHCGNTSIQTILCEHPYKDKYYSESGESNEYHALYILAKCETCSEVTLYSKDTELGIDEDTVFGSRLFPPSPARMAGVPANVRMIFEEAERVKRISPIAYAVLTRRLLEEICLEKGLKGKTLAKNLDELAKKGDVPPVIAEATSLLRLIGNAGAHASDKKITVPQVWAIGQFVSVVLEYLYIAPQRIKEFKSSFASADGGD
jgi:hypothetical protein